MNSENDWIFVSKTSKNGFNPKTLNLKKFTDNKTNYEKVYNKSKKSIEEIEFLL